MKLAGVQHDVVWEDRAATLAHLEPQLTAAAGLGARLVVLTEMFPVGFSTEPERMAEPEGGPSTEFLRSQAAALGMWLAGSVPINPARGGRPVNRFLLAGPGGELEHYDKIHPFSYSGEHEHYDAGPRRSAPTATWWSPTGRRPAGPTGRRYSWPGRSRTRPMWSASTGSAKAAGSPTPATAGSSTRSARCWPPARAVRRSSWPTSTRPWWPKPGSATPSWPTVASPPPAGRGWRPSGGRRCGRSRSGRPGCRESSPGPSGRRERRPSARSP